MILKTNLNALFDTDELAEEAGVWITVDPRTNLRIKVRRLNSDASMAAYTRITAEFYGEEKLRADEKLTTEQQQKILKRQIAEAILVDWENLYDTEKKEDIPFSVEAAEALLEMKDFLEFVVQASSTRDTYIRKVEEDGVKNS